MTKDELKALIFSGADNLTDEQVDSLTDLLSPVFTPVDFFGKTLMIQIDMNGQPPDALNRLYAYGDWLRHMGAKNVIFLPKGSDVSVLELLPSKVVVVRFFDLMPDDAKLAEYKDWFRIAGADPDKVIFLDRSTSVEVTE